MELQEPTLTEQLATAADQAKAVRLQSDALAGQLDRVQRDIADTLEARRTARANRREHPALTDSQRGGDSIASEAKSR